MTRAPSVWRVSAFDGRRIKLVALTRFISSSLFLLILLPLLATAQESVCLKTGFCLEAESHMISDGMLVVQSGHGTLQFPVEEVDGITGLPVVFVPPALPVPRPASSEQASSVDLLVRAALLEGLEPDFVRSVAMVESGLHQEAVSPKGAIGLMQLMPQTAGRLGVDAQQKEQNALGGAAYLRQLLIRYNGNSALALAAYNAGPGAVDKYKGVPPFPETRRYVVKVLEEYARQQKIQSGQSLQAAKPERSSAPEASSLEVMRAETSNPAGERTAVQR